MKRISDLERKYINEVLDLQFHTSTNSIFNSRLEKKFSEVFKSQYAIGVINGTATLHTALRALDIGPGDEVIVPPLTMSSPAISVCQAGATPVFADVDPDTFLISKDGILNVITPKTKAIMTVSLYGLAPDYDEILEICKKENIALIEDNAECFLGKYKGKLVGEFGDFASFSFQASKHLTAGEGGMLTCNKTDLADKARRFTSLGYAGVGAKERKITKETIQNPEYSRHVSLGYNYRMSELCAAVALGQLERITELVQSRVDAAKIFSEVVEAYDFLKPQFTPDYCSNSYWTYVVMLNTPNPKTDWYRFRDIYRENGGDGFYAAWKLSYLEPYFADVYSSTPGVWQKYQAGLCPNSEYIQPRLIQLKTDYWDIKDAEREAEVLSRSLRQFKIGL